MKAFHSLMCVGASWLLATAQAPMKLLMVYEASDGGHSPMPIAGKPTLTKMGTTSNFTIDFSPDQSALTDANLAKYDLLMIINHYPFDLNATSQAAIQKWIEAGKGWIGIHSVGCAQPSWPWYSNFMGKTNWKGHANLRDGTLLIEDNTHAITKSLPASMSLKEEWYEFTNNPRPNVKVLAKAGNTGNSGYDGGDHPLVWCSLTYPKAVYISPGHDPSDWGVPAYVSMVQNAIAWATASSTQIKMQQAYLGQPKSERAWISDGVLNLGPQVSGWATKEIRLTDAGGRRLSIVPIGNTQFRILGSHPDECYFLSAVGLSGSSPVIRRP